MTERDDVGELEPYRHRGFAAWLGRVVITLLIITVILYAGMIAIFRTEGVRSIIEEWLGRELGMTLDAESLKLDFDLSLVMTKITSVEVDTERSSALRADRLRVIWFPRFLHRGGVVVEIDGAGVILERDGKGNWSPEPFFIFIETLARWIEWEVPVESVSVKSTDDDSAEEPSPVRRINNVLEKQVSWVLRDTSVLWRESRGMIMAEIDGLNVEVTPLHTPSRILNHWLISARERKMMGVLIEDADIEFLSGVIEDGEGIEVAIILNQRKE